MNACFRNISFLVLTAFVTIFAVAADPSNALQAADADMHAGKYTEAAKKYKDANKQAGNNCFACLLGLSAALQHTGDMTGALDNAAKALRVAQSDRDRAEAHNAAGNVHLLMAKSDPKRFKQAENEFHAALAADPTFGMAHVNLGVALLRQSRDAEGIQELQQYLANSPSPEVAAEVKRLIAEPDRARLRFAPNFQLTAEGGKPVSLQELSGKYVILDFWATWCGPCRESVPELKDLAKRYSGRVVVLSLSADSNEKAWREFIAKKDMDWLQYRDADGKMMKLFGVQAFPTYVLIDRRGVIRQFMTGLDEHKSLAYRLKDELDAMMKSEVH